MAVQMCENSPSKGCGGGDGAVLRRHGKEATEAAKGGPKNRAVRRQEEEPFWRHTDCADFALGSRAP